METIDVSQIQDITSIGLINKNVDLSKFNFQRRDLLISIDSHLKEMMYYSGRDNFIANKRRIIASEYKQMILEYNELYNSGKAITKEIKEIAFEYENRYLRDSYIIYFGNVNKLVTFNGKSCVYDIVYELYENSGDKDLYPLLGEYINRNNNMKKVLK